MFAVRSDGTLWNHDHGEGSLNRISPYAFPAQQPGQGSAGRPGGEGQSHSYLVVMGDGTVRLVGHWVPGQAYEALLPPRGNQDIRCFKPQPDFGVLGPDDTTAVRVGTTVDIPVNVARTGGFTGSLEVTAPELPPGVSLSPLILAADATSGTLTLTLTADASLPEGTELPFQVSGGGQVRQSYLKLRTLAGP